MCFYGIKKIFQNLFLLSIIICLTVVIVTLTVCFVSHVKSNPAKCITILCCALSILISIYMVVYMKYDIIQSIFLCIFVCSAFILGYYIIFLQIAESILLFIAFNLFLAIGYGIIDGVFSIE